MKKIGIITHNPFTNSGVPQITRLLAKNLKNSFDYEVFIISGVKKKKEFVKEIPVIYLSDYEKNDKKYRIRNGLFKRSRMCQFFFNIPPFSFFHPKKSRAKALKELLKEHQFDILISNTPTYVYELANATKKKDITTLSWIHNDYFGTFDEEYGWHNKDYFDFKKYHSKLDTNIILTKYALDEFENSFKGSFVQIYNGVKLPKKSKLQEIPEAPKVFGLVTRLDERQKQVSHAISAFRKLKNSGMELCIYGQGSESEVAHYQKLIGKHKHIKIIKGVKNKEQIYSSIDCLVVTSKHEGFSLTILEALSYSKPIIAYDIPSVKEIIKDRHNGLIVETDNQKALRKKIESLSKKSKLYHDLSKNARKSVKKLSMNEIVDEWHLLFNNLIKN